MEKSKNDGQPAPTPGSSTTEAPLEQPKVRDTWDYIEILGRPVSAFITALAVASIGIFGNFALNKSNEAAKNRAETEQNTRLYTQLLSSREQADSNLRKDMFNTILGEFLSDSVESKDKETDVVALSDRLLKLELLALNFGDALSLRPLFQEMNRIIESKASTIRAQTGRNDAAFFKGLFLPRLKSLARRVSDRQTSLLSAGGSTFTISIDPKDAGGAKDGLQNVDDLQKVYEWPSDTAEANWELYGKLSGKPKEEWIQDEIEIMKKVLLDGIEREYEITLSNANLEKSEVVVNLKIQDTLGADIIEMNFKLNFFNFPMIDNTRLTGDQRFALVLKKFNKKEILIEGICFPGSYASYRDKPFLNDVVEQLRLSNIEDKATTSREE